MTNNVNQNMYLIDSIANNSFQLGQNNFIGSQTGLLVQGNGTTGPVVTMNADSFTASAVYYIEEITAPNDIWPSTANVSFDGLVSGFITFAQYQAIRTKILDKFNRFLTQALDWFLILSFLRFQLLRVFLPISGFTTGGGP